MNPQDQPTDTSQDRQEYQPGQATSPQQTSQPAASPSSAAAPLAPASPPQNYSYTPPAPAPAQPSAPVSYQPATPPSAPASSPESFYRPESSADPTPQQTYVGYRDTGPDDNQDDYAGDSVRWTASEFIAHHKSAEWYLILGAGGFFLALLVFLITRDFFNTIIVAIALGLFGFMANRQPRQLEYIVDAHGLIVGGKPYAYGNFRSFSIADEGHFHSITLMPLKRFMPPLSIYYDPADEKRIADVLSAHLPLEDHRLDMTEKLTRRIRF